MNVYSGKLKIFLRGINLEDVLRRSVAYKSALSLENLYPTSSLKLTTPSEVIINTPFIYFS